MTSLVNRRAFVTGLGAVLAAPLAVEAQPAGKLSTIGWVGKWVELLREVVPRLSPVAVLFNPDARNADRVKELRAAAATLKLELVTFEVHRANELDRASSSRSKTHVRGLIVVVDPLTLRHRAES